MTDLVTLQASDDTSAMIKTLEKDGCVIVEGLAKPSETTELQQHMQSTFATIPDQHGNVYSDYCKRIGTLFSQHQHFQTFATYNPIIEIMDHFLLNGCSDYQINMTQASSIGSGSISERLMQADLVFPYTNQDQEIMVNCMWAIDDFTLNNGAPALIPGSHKWPRSEKLAISYSSTIEKSKRAVMKKGSVLIYLGSLLHAERINETNQLRSSALISYSLGWLRQAENSYLAYTQTEIAKMPARLRHLLGYFIHHPNVGLVNGIEPYAYLEMSQQERLLGELMPDMQTTTLFSNITKTNKLEH